MHQSSRARAGDARPPARFLFIRVSRAFDAATGKILWEFVTNSGIVAPPSTFTVDGKQYLAVQSGWGGDVRGMNGGLGRMFPGKVPEPPEGGGMWVFALP